MQNHKQLAVVLGIVEKDGKFLILQRVDDTPIWHHKWELPGGKIDINESPLVAVQREVLEETGLKIQKPELLGIHTHHWNLPDTVQQTFLIVYRSEAKSDDVVLDPEENDGYKWVTLEEFLDIPDCDHLEANREMILELYEPLCRRNAENKV